MAGKPMMCVKAGCDRTWPRDPAREVACPDCRAPIGAPCKRPSGHGAWQNWVHAARDLLADRQGHYGACPLGLCGTKAVATLPPAQQPAKDQPLQLRLF